MAETIYSKTPLQYCQHSLEAYKFLRSATADLRWQATQYQRYRERLEAWQQCCPALRDKAAALTPAITDPAVALPAFPLDIVLASNGPCGSFFFESGGSEAAAEGKAWLEDFNKQRAEYWKKTYSQLSADLQACCQRQLSKCLAAAPQDVSGKAAAPAAAASCIKQHAPPEIAAPQGGAPEASAAAPSAATEAAAKQLGEAIVAGSALLREQGCREQLFYLVQFTGVATEEYRRCDRDLQTAHGQTQAVTEERTLCLQQAGERQEEAFRLQAELRSSAFSAASASNASSTLSMTSPNSESGANGGDVL